MLKAAVFDLDGVITDSATYHFKAWQIIADKLGIPFDESYNELLKGVSRMESLNLILDKGLGREAYTESDKLRWADEKNEAYKELIKQITPDDLLPGILNVLKECKNAGVKVALASVSKNAPAIIKNLQIGDYFDYMADASKIERSKPYPDIFLDCINACGVEAKDAVGIEDAEAGIKAIKAAGMKAVGVGSRDKMYEADIALNGTEELTLKLFESLV